MSNELTLQEAALAWAQGKRVEAMGPSNAWGLIQEVGSSDGMWQPGVFSGDNSRVFRFRLAPEPPAKKWRPWTPEEVPVGAQIRHKDWDGGMYGRFTIAAVNSRKIGWVVLGGFGSATLAEAANDSGYTHSTDHGKTWLPCGVEVES